MKKLHINPFRIGCDPEFSLWDKTTTIPTLITTGSIIPSSGSIGSDHGGTVIELRPKPSFLVCDVIENLKEFIEHPTMSPLHGFRFRAGAFARYTHFKEATPDGNPTSSARAGGDSLFTGGHVHLELPYKGKHGVSDNMFDDRVAGCDRMTQILEQLDIHPLLECSTRRRAGGGYGAFGAVQPANTQTANPDGTQFIRMEYRTPCSWLNSPETAYLTLTGIKLAALAPQFVKDSLKGATKEEKFSNLVTFFRRFSVLDYDANVVSKKILRSKKMSNLEALVAKPEEDFRPKWEAANFF